MNEGHRRIPECIATLENMENFCRIEADNKTFYLVIKTLNRGIDGFDITLCDGEQVWKASVSKEKLHSMAKGVDMGIDEYVDQSINGLVQQSSSKGNFLYDAIKEDQNLKFSWKKKLGDGVKFQLGSVTLKIEPDCHKSITEILGLSVNQITQYKEEISDLKSENNRLSIERQRAMKLLEECTTAKNEMEKDLFQKFAIILNEKKAKIRQLQAQVTDYAKDITDAVQPKNMPQTRYLSESESTESRTPSPPLSSQDDLMAVENTSITTNHLILDDEEEPMDVNAKRRKRRGHKKETPRSNLVLPKVSSVRKTPSASSEDSLGTRSTRGRLRKGTSERPPDPDELMAEMRL